MDWWLHWQVTSGLSNTAGGLPHCSLDLCISGKSSYWGCNASWACAAAPTAGAKGFLDRVIITLGNGPLFFSSFDSCCFWYALDNRRLLAFKVLQWTTGGLNNNYVFIFDLHLSPKKASCFSGISLFPFTAPVLFSPQVIWCMPSTQKWHFGLPSCCHFPWSICYTEIPF